jgi:uncharacterized protein YjiS (DUF1127 family)
MRTARQLHFRISFISGVAVMAENLRGECGLSLHDRHRDGGCSTVPSTGAISGFLRPADRLQATVWTVSACVDYLAPRQGSPRPAAPEAPLLGRNEARAIAPVGPISRIVATIRLWRRRVRSRQELRELNDHLLKDIGLSRDAVACEVAKPFWR